MMALAGQRHARHGRYREGERVTQWALADALTALEPFDVDVIGLNCAAGPKEMNDAVRFLGLNSSKLISILPNAGLPSVVEGKMHYDVDPAQLAERAHDLLVTDDGEMAAEIALAIVAKHQALGLQGWSRARMMLCGEVVHRQNE